MAVHGHAVARFHRTGDGLQRLGGYGEGALRFAIWIPAEANGLGGSWHCSHARRHEHRLQEVSPAIRGVYISRLHVPVAYCSVPLSRFAQHAPLDQVWWLLLPAVGIGKTRAHPGSRIFSRIALAADRRLEARAGSGRDADDPFRAAHREGTGPGY